MTEIEKVFRESPDEDLLFFPKRADPLLITKNDAGGLQGRFHCAFCTMVNSLDEYSFDPTLNGKEERGGGYHDIT